MDLNTLKEDNQLHDLSHESDIDPKKLLGKDISCQICYPLFTPEPDNFEDFWYWYQTQFGAYRYSGFTLDLFGILKQITKELNEQYEDLDLVRTITSQVAALIKSFRYKKVADLPPVAELIFLLIKTNCIEKGSVPFAEWSNTTVKVNDYIFDQEFNVDSTEESTSSLKPATTRTHRSGQSYNQDPSKKYQRRSYKASTQSTLARAQKAFEAGSLTGNQPTQSSQPTQTPQAISKSSDESEETITQANLDTIIEENPESSEESDTSETTINYTEANKELSPIDEE